jgi:hypothetical protein
VVDDAIAGVGSRCPGYRSTMQTRTIGQAGLRGWRSTVADAAAGPVSRRTPLGEEQVRAAIGGVFLLLSVIYVAKAISDLLGERG